jgi:hypothetical protein
VELLLDAIVAGVAYRREAFECLRENARVGVHKPAPTQGRRRST